MKEKVHKTLAKQVGDLLNSNKDWKVLIAASVVSDLKEGWRGHHRSLAPMEDLEEIMNLIYKARQAHLENPFSDESQRYLGEALHLIQDRFIQSTNKPNHARFEVAISRALDSLPSWVRPTLLDGEKEILSYLEREVKFIKDSYKILLEALKVSYSVAKAVYENERGFTDGLEAKKHAENLRNHIMLLQEEIKEVKYHIPKLNSEIKNIVSETKSKIDEIQNAYQKKIRKRSSLIRKILAILLLEDYRYRRTLRMIKSSFDRKISKLSEDFSKRLYLALHKSKKISQIRDEINSLFEKNYKGKYEKRLENPAWYGITNIGEFVSPEELTELIEMTNELFISVKKLKEVLKLRIEEARRIIGEISPCKF